MAKKVMIHHRNDARQAIAGLKLSTRRILYLAIFQQARDSNGFPIFEKDKIYSITAKQYSELCSIDESVAYKQLKEGVRDIRSYLMEIPEDEIQSDNMTSTKGKGRVVVFTMANYGVYSDGEGYVELRLDPIIAPYISDLNKNFTGQFLLSGLRLSDNNANRLYMLLREWVSSGMTFYKEITFESLKEKLSISDVGYYEAYKDFNRTFWQRAVLKVIELTEFSDIKIEIIERRKRKAHLVRVSYVYNEQDKHKRDADLASIVPASKADPEVRPSKRALEMMQEVESLKK